MPGRNRSVGGDSRARSGAAGLLQVPLGASAEEIRRSFTRAVRAVHPDAGGDPSVAALRLAALVAARNELLGAGPGQSPRPAAASPIVTAYRRRRVPARWWALRARRAKRDLG